MQDISKVGVAGSGAAGALRIGIAGLGTVGASVVRLMAKRDNLLNEASGRRIKVVAVSARDRNRDRGIALDGMRWVDDPVALAADGNIDVFVELMGGAEGPAKQAVETALGAGKAVVTANKALLAAHGTALARRAEKKGVPLNFEAAVAGGIPVIKTLREGLVGNAIERVYGILNGTCNYILTRMAEEGISFESCLEDAQRLGYAEADPTFDVDGFDTAHKLSLLTSLAFGTLVDTKGISIEGIRSIKPVDLKMADELGYRVKLLGVAQRTADGVEQRVHPTFVPKESAIAQVNGVLNAVAIDADAVDLTLVGPGAGGDATASAVIADIADIARGHRTAPFIRPIASLTQPTRAPLTRHEGGYYIRLEVVDRPGTAARIASRMAQNKISLESIVQRRSGPVRGGTDPAAAEAPAPVVLITYATTEAAVQRALKAMDADGVLLGRPQVIRIERS
ncbi:homoserine dehydrogenase [Phreatobacter sp. AB_2022a]|uniref:homoserine dehydrogenase n=1 Tax=Phreatobacter sp. AB_2022a TaxID=3003134 RepID=UPI002286FCBA|nr:homoserine dehydrogenase [Phreatobacter sp. AB_2022a]MCZ0733439.1 homoserine dehydrogenase [Phreatobacter sp. AB_2022a]